MTQLFPCCTVSAAISECLGYSQISCYSFRFCGIMRTKLRKYLVNHFIILKDCSWTLLFLPDDMNNWLLTSLNQIGTIYSKYILKICEDVGPILQKQSLTKPITNITILPITSVGRCVCLGYVIMTGWDREPGGMGNITKIFR